MSNISSNKVQEEIIALIADTFDVKMSTPITADTQPGDITGWDSLGHSVLLTRLSRRFGLKMSESWAAPVNNVGELVAKVEQIMENRVHG
jgi:acyl carrier protein